MEKDDVIGSDLLENFPGHSLNLPVPAVISPATEGHANHTQLRQDQAQFRVCKADWRSEGKRQNAKFLETILGGRNLQEKFFKTTQHQARTVAMGVITDQMSL